MNPSQHRKLRENLKNFSALSLEALASRLDVTEDALLTTLQAERVPLRYRAGVLWVEGRRARWTLRQDKQPEPV